MVVQERARQRKEYEALIAGRDILGTQLVRRNDEVALLYAKLRLQTSALQVCKNLLSRKGVWCGVAWPTNSIARE